MADGSWRDSMASAANLPKISPRRTAPERRSSSASGASRTRRGAPIVAASTSSMKSAESPSVIYRYTVPWIEIYTWEFIVIKACYCLTLLCYILNQDGADHLSLLSHNTGVSCTRIGIYDWE